jgi:hypothetical protein
MKATSIPITLPRLIHKEDVHLVKQWMATRPDHDYDNCVNSMSRWKYTYIDHGLCSNIEVIDLVVGGEGSVFSVPIPDVSTW